jgi:hypothetical protein
MQIVTPSVIEQVAWEGSLEPVDAVYKGLERLPIVTIGEPASWPAAEAVEARTGQNWSPPAGDRRYTLVRLDCTLHAPEDTRTRYSDATLTAYLRPREGMGTVVAHDLYPQRVVATDTQKLSLRLGPDLKFGPVNVNLFEAKTEIVHHNTFPIIQAFGLGESKPYWQFAYHTTHPLLGCQSVYVVLSSPLDAGGVRLLVEVNATAETRFGPLRLGLPQSANAYVSRVIV